jgi:outer membrane protein TolC
MKRILMRRPSRVAVACAAYAASLACLGSTNAGAQPRAATARAKAGPPPSTPAAVRAPDLLRAERGALTAEQVGRRAAETSYSAKASEEGIRAAAARVDAAWANYLPRITTTARYTRLSDLTPPAAFPFPIFVNQYFLQAAIVVPISDYFLRINEAYSAVTQAEAAARADLVAAKAKSAADGKVAYYGWLTARASEVVAQATLELQKTLVQDAKNQFAAGNASRADVLQAESSVAAAELTVERAKNLSKLTERQVRIAIHAPEDEKLAPGEDFEAALPPLNGNLAELVREAGVSRYEVKSIDANAESAVAQARASRGGRLPSVSGFGDVTYANPNPRQFPPEEKWFPTWAVGAQLVWSPSDVLIAGANGREADARAAQLVAQKGLVRDGIDLEVTQAWQTVKEAEVATETTKRQLESAAEAYRVARELFTHGRATATQVREAETAFTRARLESLNARAQARMGRVRLEHAVGRDARAFVQ